MNTWQGPKYVSAMDQYAVLQRVAAAFRKWRKRFLQSNPSILSGFRKRYEFQLKEASRKKKSHGNVLINK